MHRCINYGQGLYLMKRLANLKMRRCLCAWGGNNAVVSEIRLQAGSQSTSQGKRTDVEMHPVGCSQNSEWCINSFIVFVYEDSFHNVKKFS